MNDRDATFVMGDWKKPHKIGKPLPIEDHPTLAAVKCSCGWSVMTERQMAIKMGKLHLERASDHSR